MVASPQTEGGFTKFANELIDNALTKINLSAYESRILWVIWRKTYGWGKTEDSISVSQFAKMTGLDRRHTQRTLNGLISRNIILKKEGYVNTFRFNKNYETWDYSRLGKHKTIAKKGYTLTIAKGGYRVFPKGATKLLPKGARTKEKRNYTKEITQQAEEIYSAYPKKADRNNSIKSIQKILKSGVTKETLLRAVKIYKKQIERQGTERDYIIQSNNFFGRVARYKEFLEVPEQAKLSPIERAIQKCKERGDY